MPECFFGIKKTFIKVVAHMAEKIGRFKYSAFILIDMDL